MDEHNPRERRVALHGPTTLMAAAGRPCVVHDAVLVLIERGGRVDAATLTFHLDGPTHAEVAASAEFHLAPELGGETVGPPIDPGRPVEVTASLHTGLLGELTRHIDALGPTEGFFRSIADAEPACPILRTASWLATSRCQEGPRGVSRQGTFWGLLPRSADALGALARGDHHALVRDFVRARIGGDLAALDDAVDRADAARLVDQLGEVVAGALRILARDETDRSDDPDHDRRRPDEYDDPEGGALMARVKAALEADGWSTVSGEDGASILTAAVCESGDVYTQTFWIAEDRYLVCYAAIAAAPPAGRLPALFELVARANNHLPAGAFEVDLESGEVRFRCAHYVDEGTPSDRTLLALVETTTRTMDSYAPAIRAVFAGAAPLAALAAVEGDDPHAP